MYNDGGIFHVKMYDTIRELVNKKIKKGKHNYLYCPLLDIV